MIVLLVVVYFVVGSLVMVELVVFALSIDDYCNRVVVTERCRGL